MGTSPRKMVQVGGQGPQALAGRQTWIQMPALPDQPHTLNSPLPESEPVPQLENRNKKNLMMVVCRLNQAVTTSFWNNRKEWLVVVLVVNICWKYRMRILGTFWNLATLDFLWLAVCKMQRTGNFSALTTLEKMGISADFGLGRCLWTCDQSFSLEPHLCAGNMLLCH